MFTKKDIKTLQRFYYKKAMTNKMKKLFLEIQKKERFLDPIFLRIHFSSHRRLYNGAYSDDT